ncbi:hypothetical protein GCM10028803_31500 [Larkinella knui]
MALKPKKNSVLDSIAWFNFREIFVKQLSERNDKKRLGDHLATGANVSGGSFVLVSGLALSVTDAGSEKL